MVSIKFFTLTTCCLIILNIEQGKGATNGPTCVLLGSKCYELAAEARNWFQAQAYCRRNNGDLAAFQNSVEYNLVANYLLTQDKSGLDQLWIDGTDLADEGVFRSIKTGSELPFFAWSADNPNNQDGNEDCIELRKDNNVIVMNDRDCTVQHAAICEYSLNLSPYYAYGK